MNPSNSYLDVINIVMTFIIGVVVTLHLGKFSYRKQRREDLANAYVSLRKVIREFQWWHISHSQRLPAYQILEKIRDYRCYDNPEFDKFLVRHKHRIVRYIYNRYSGLSDFESNLDLRIDFFIYSGSSPYAELDLFMLKLSKREIKKMRYVTKQLLEEFDKVRSNFEFVRTYQYSAEYKEILDVSLKEAIGVLTSLKEGYMTENEVIDELHFLIDHFGHVIFKDKRFLIERSQKLVDLTDEYRKMIICM